MSEAALEFPFDEVGQHIAELRQAARQGGVVYLTEGGRRLAAVVPCDTTQPAAGTSRLAAVSGVLPGFENDVDVEATREGWDQS